MLEIARSHENCGKGRRALLVLKDASERVAFADHGDGAVECLVAMAALKRKLGRSDGAAKALRIAHERAVASDNDEELARVLFELGNGAYSQGLYTDAMDKYLEAGSLYERLDNFRGRVECKARCRAIMASELFDDIKADLSANSTTGLEDATRRLRLHIESLSNSGDEQGAMLLRIRLVRRLIYQGAVRDALNYELPRLKEYFESSSATYNLCRNLEDVAFMLKAEELSERIHAPVAESSADDVIDACQQLFQGYISLYRWRDAVHTLQRLGIEASKNDPGLAIAAFFEPAKSVANSVMES